MNYTKEEIESRLKELLYDLLRSGNQEGSILSLNYNEKKQECNVTLTVNIIEEDDYIGFDGY
jgi:hypothetical protein